MKIDKGSQFLKSRKSYISDKLSREREHLLEIFKKQVDDFIIPWVADGVPMYLVGSYVLVGSYLLIRLPSFKLSRFIKGLSFENSLWFRKGSRFYIRLSFRKGSSFEKKLRLIQV